MSSILSNKLRSIDFITEDEASQALNKGASKEEPFIITLERLGIRLEDETIEKIAKEFKIQTDYYSERNMEIDVAERLPFSFSKRYNVVAYKEDSNNVYMAVLDPFNRQVLENARIQLRTNKRLIPVLTRYSSMNNLLARLDEEENARLPEDDNMHIYAATEEEEDLEQINISQRIEADPLVKKVDSVILEAYRAGASDIHIEPENRMTNIRFRVDGTLYIHETIESSLHSLFCSRVKIISGLDPANRKNPQDGSFKYSTSYMSIDIRVSTLPTSNGEKVVLRLLGADKNINYDLHSLGIRSYVLEAIERAIRIPNGIILVTGPTGSGKTTTLYTILNKLATPETSIVTVEDPVERNIEGVSQVQVNLKAGLGFAESLRSILRQDPDTIMIGEMRDQETAQIATRAAITGHLVLSTIHTNDAISTISRLTDMGVEPYMISSSLKCVIAQRLVKKVCNNCKIEHVNTDIEKDLIKINDSISYQGEGCDECKNTGYRGRTAVFEILEINEELGRLIANNASMEKLLDHVREKGSRTMRQEVLELVENGTTSIEEAIKILYTIE